jgi:hypothetical protein
LPFLLETQKRLFNFVIVKRGRKKPALGWPVLRREEQKWDILKIGLV